MGADLKTFESAYTPIKEYVKLKVFPEEYNPLYVRQFLLSNERAREIFNPHSPDDALSFGTDGAIQI
jgi:hypothetical protein